MLWISIQGNCRRKRDIEDGVDKNNLTEVTSNESVEKETSNLLQDEEINTDNLTITGNKTTGIMLTENDIYIINNVTSTENITQSINSIVLTTENINNFIENNNIQTNNNRTIIIENITSSENETQVLDNFTITIENITNNINNDNFTIVTESTISKTNTTQSIEEITNNPQALAMNEITTIITPEIRKEMQNAEDYKEIDINNSENIFNVNQNSNTTLNINQTNSKSETLFSENGSSFNYEEINEDGGNLTSTVFANVNNTNNENQTINLEISLIENNLTSKHYKTINESELEQNYNISIIYDEKNSVVYPNNFTFHEDMFDTQCNDNNTIINQNMSILSEDITVSSIINEKESTVTATNMGNNLNFTNSFNVSDLETSSEILDIDLFSNFTNVLNETIFNLTESENVIFTNSRNESNINATPDKLKDELTESGREKREIVMNLTSFNLGTTNETYKAEEHLTNKKFSVDNATVIKTETTIKSTPVNDTVQSSAVKDTNVAMTTEKVCLIQGEAVSMKNIY